MKNPFSKVMYEAGQMDNCKDLNDFDRSQTVSGQSIFNYWVRASSMAEAVDCFQDAVVSINQK